MKTSLLLLILLTELFFSDKVTAQQNEMVRFANGNLITGNNIEKNIFKKENLISVLFDGQYFVVVQFGVLPSNEVKLNLQIAGIQLGNYISNNAYLATIKKQFIFETALQYQITSINVMPAGLKITRELQNYLPQNKQLTSIAVSYIGTVNRNIVEKELQNAGAIIIKTKFTNAPVIFITVDKKIINTLAALPFVSGVSLQILSDEPLNNNSRAAHGISGLNALGGKNLNGKGVTIGIGDNADISTHADFSGRLILRTPALPDNHGTHVAGTAAGAGIVNVKYRGMASRSIVINQYFSDVISNAPTYVVDNNMVLTNNSYFSSQVGCPGNGVYNVFSNYIDQQALSLPQLLHNVSSGNDGALTCSAYPQAYGTVKSGWQCAKNVLTVGAMNVQNYSIASFSSRGPVADGRIKPEITSNGWAVVSTNTNNNYGTDYGTSMACPAVTGILALLYERYRQLNMGANPTSALMKALVCNTAEDLGNKGPDYTFGFGMINARRAVSALESNRYFTNTINNGGKNIQTISVPANTRRVKVMLYWTDVAAAPNAPSALVNDLDLTVSEPAGLLHKPLILNPAPLFVNEGATEGADHLNNIEQVVIENPATGNYSINVAGFSVPSGAQNYVISYEIVQPGVTVEYPCGGETLVPGETENIRWSAEGDEANTFNLGYSIDNGLNWISINNALAANSRVFSWVVPSSVTNNALVRVSRNNSLLTGQSNYSFGILGQPAITAANVCEGAVQLNWGVVAGATSYDILQLTGDSMKIIGNSNGNNFLVAGLDKNKKTWLGVAAKMGSFSGRRSISLSALPNSGACTLAAFINDVKVDSILAPTSARQYFLNEGMATAPVQISIKNLGSASINNPFEVSFNYGAATVTETVNSAIAAGGTFIYTFTGLYPIILTGYKYNFKAWVTLAADANHLNDTAYKVVKFINNDAISTMPVIENFELMPDINVTKTEMAIGENKYIDFTASTDRGRARTFVNTGFAHSGFRSITLDQSPYNATSNSDSLTLNYNLVNYADNQLRFDFYYKSHGQTNNGGNKIWIRGSENNDWLEAYDLFVNQGQFGQWTQGLFNITEVLSNAIPAQIITPTFQIRIREKGNTSANTPNPITGIDEGYTFDDLKLYQVYNDVELKQIISPDKAGCGLSSNTPLIVSIKNHNNYIIKNIKISYQINGGAVVNEIMPAIAAYQLLNYTFLKNADLSAYADQNIKVWINYAPDTYNNNDSILNYIVHNSPVINSFPYLQSFETSDGNFYTNGTNTSWQWGIPSKLIINKSASGSKAWVTNLTGLYADNETSYLYTPCFNLSSLTKPVLSFSHIFEVELDYDFTWVEYSTDGIIWQKLGAAGAGVNWYQSGNTWKVSNKKWHVASIDLPVTTGNIRFRFVLSSDAGVTMEGIGIDDVRIHEKSDVLETQTNTTITVAAVSGNSWIPFYTGNQATGPWYLIAEINPNGQDLGAVKIDLYPNTTGVVRNSDNQYYLNRNYVIHPVNPASSAVSVRLYFTDAEVDSMVNAKNCSTCLKPTDAYGLGVTKYSGTTAEENGTLDDNIKGFSNYLTPANTSVIPHGNGYYAAFTVNSFSEFWFNSGGANNIQPLPIDLLFFDAVKQAGNALLSWKAAHDVNVAKFIIERSVDSRNFISIGNLASNGTENYAFTDAQPIIGLNYYRLKILKRDGTVKFSPLRKLDFRNNGDDFLIYPNPITNATLFISSNAFCSSCTLYDAAGKLVKSFVLQGRNNSINIKGIASGIYTLKIIAENATHSEKIFVQ